MSGRKLRWLTGGLFASAGAGMLSVTAVMNSAFAFGETDPGIDPVGLIIGASGHRYRTPSQDISPVLLGSTSPIH